MVVTGPRSTTATSINQLPMSERPIKQYFVVPRSSNTGTNIDQLPLSERPFKQYFQLPQNKGTSIDQLPPSERPHAPIMVVPHAEQVVAELERVAEALMKDLFSLL